MKIIDLLNKIANGEEVPNTFKYREYLFYYDEYNNCYFEEGHKNLFDILTYLKGFSLNEEVEILEEEEKKIPEKLDLYEETQNIIRENNYKLVYHDIHKCIVSLECKYNQLLDYLKSKGE